MNILLAAGGTADEYIVNESLKLLYIFVAAGSWIIGALIFAAIFWKAGEERWKAYIPIYNIVIIFRIASMPATLVLLPVATIALAALAFLLAPAAPPVALALLLIAIGAYLAYSVLYLIAIYRIGVHLGHSGAGWIVLTIFLPIVPLIVFAVDRSIWRDDSELGWESGRIGDSVPRYTR